MAVWGTTAAAFDLSVYFFDSCRSQHGLPQWHMFEMRHMRRNKRLQLRSDALFGSHAMNGFFPRNAR